MLPKILKNGKESRTLEYMFIVQYVSLFKKRTKVSYLLSVCFNHLYAPQSVGKLMPMVNEKFSLDAIEKQGKLDTKITKKVWSSYMKMEFMLLQLAQEMSLRIT